MLHVHTIGRIGKDCQVIAGAHGSFMAMNIAVDDYAKGQNITTWVKVRSSKENHIRLAEYLTKGRLVLVEGTLSSSLWTDKNGESQIQLSITAESIAFINTGKKDSSAGSPDNMAATTDNSASATIVRAVQMLDTLMMTHPTRKAVQTMPVSLILFSRFFMTIACLFFRCSTYVHIRHAAWG